MPAYSFSLSDQVPNLLPAVGDEEEIGLGEVVFLEGVVYLFLEVFES